MIVSAYFGVTYPIPDPPEILAEPVETEQVETLGTTNFTDLELTGDLTVGDDATITGDLVVDDVFGIDELSNTDTGTTTLNPVSTYYQVAPVTVLTLTLGTTGVEVGDLLIVHNTVATTTTIVDTGATVGGSDVTLAANDLAVFIYGNSKWIEVASPDNS